MIAVAGRFAMHEKKSSQPLWDIFGVGVDLMISACIALPTIMGDVALRATPSDMNDAAQTLSIGGWLTLLMLPIFLAGVTFERLWGRPARNSSGVVLPLILGVVIPTIFGLLALAVVYVFVTLA